MSRGRKPNHKAALIDWNYIFKRNVGAYFNIILSHIGYFPEIGTGYGTDVLKEIIKEKEHRRLKDKEFPKISVNEMPYKIPKNWIWCRLGEISINRDGERNPISLSERNNREKIYDYYGASGVIDKIDGYTHEGELLLIGEDGANLVTRSTPIAFIATGKYWVNNHAHVLETVHRITLDYLKYYINSIDLKPFVTGGFQPKLSQGNLNIIPVPLPPISFQEKIIEFISDFENNRIKSNGYYFNSQIEKEIIELHKSQLSAATIISENNFQLTQLENLNQAILQEAVQGKLVKQDPKDEPASELLKRIKAEKAKSGKNEKPLPPIKPEEIPFEIPENWVWCRLGEICERIHYGFNASAKASNSGVRLLRITDIQENAVDWETVPGCDYTNSDLVNYLLNENDIVIARTGGTIGKTYLVKSIPLQSLFASYLIRAIPSKAVFPEYAKCFMESPIYWKQLYEAAGGAAQPNVNGTSLSNLLFPLPPLSEQKRIVEDIEKQFAKTKQLKENILANQQATEQLLKALLHQAFEVREAETTII